MATRADIVRIARSYLGTPYFDQGNKPGIGLDCAHLLACVGIELGIYPPDLKLPDYTGTPNGSMLRWCDEYLGPRVTRAEMRAGDAIVMITESHPQHLGILADYRRGGLSIIHASNDKSYMQVIETRLMFARKQRFAAAYAFPGVTG